jgi:hypothetical protein
LIAESNAEHGIGRDMSKKDVLPLPAPIATVEAARVASFEKGLQTAT